MKAEIKLDGNRLKVRTPYSPLLVERFRTLPGAKWHADEKEWSFPAVRDVLLMTCDVCGLLPWMLPQELRELAGRSPYMAVERVPLDESVIAEHHFRTAPYDHQRTNLARLVTHDRWLLADEMGAGKSFCVANRLAAAKTPFCFPVLIVCPKSVVSVWVEQLSQHAGLYGYPVHGKFAAKQEPGRGIFIANYERVLQDAEAFPKVDWRTIVIDEVHRCKGFTAKTSRVIRKLTAKAKYVYGLSGTPAPNGLEDWLGVLTAIDPSIFKDDMGNVISTKAGFNARYCVMGRLSEDRGSPLYHQWKVVGYRNVDELHARIASITSRVTKAECLDLPEKVFSTRKVTLSGEQARVYRELKKDAVARLAEKAVKGICPYCGSEHFSVAGTLACLKAANNPTLTVNNVLTESLRLLQVVGGFVPDDDGRMHELPDKAKVEAMQEVLEEVGDKQVVIWCAFVEEAGWLAQWLFEQYRCSVSLLTGRITSGTVRQEEIEKFARGQNRFFVGTSAGGEGVNGLQCADTEIFYSRTWNLKDFLQQTDRLHRIGQKNAVSVVKLVADCTVDCKVDEALERKASLQEMLLTDPETLF